MNTGLLSICLGHHSLPWAVMFWYFRFRSSGSGRQYGSRLELRVQGGACLQMTITLRWITTTPWWPWKIGGIFYILTPVNRLTCSPIVQALSWADWRCKLQTLLYWFYCGDSNSNKTERYTPFSVISGTTVTEGPWSGVMYQGPAWEKDAAFSCSSCSRPPWWGLWKWL